MRSRGYESELIHEALNHTTHLYDYIGTTDTDIPEKIVEFLHKKGYRLTTESEVSFDD